MDLLVESIEGDIYLAYQVSGERKTALVDANNQPVHFHSLNQIKEYVDGTPFKSASLLHCSAYDEMCGLPSSSGPTTMLINLNWY